MTAMRTGVRALAALAAFTVAAGTLAACTIDDGGDCDSEALACVGDEMVEVCVEGRPTVVPCSLGTTCVDPLGCTACIPGAIACSDDGTEVLVCAEDGSALERDVECAATEICVPGLGCRACAPSETRCDGDTLTVCRDDGSGFDVLETCDPAADTLCRDGAGECIGADALCAVVADEGTNLGCDFFAAPLASCGTPLDTAFTVLIANAFPLATTVTIEREGVQAHEPIALPPGGSRAVQLPCAAVPQEPGLMVYSGIRRGGAYRLRSDTPVTVVQLQPTEDESVVPDDFMQLGDGALLMPARAATCSSAQPCDFFGMSTSAWLSAQGSLAIVGTDDRPVNVWVRLSAPITPSIDGFTGRPDTIPIAFEGEEIAFTLAPGDVVELTTQLPRSGFFYNLFHDFTGTRVRADGSVSVISGSITGFVPIGSSAPNAIGESVPPISAWGTEHVVARPRPLAGEPYLLKVLSAEDGTDVSFEPEIYPSRRLRSGESFEILAHSDVVVRSTRPALVAVFTVGRSLYTPGDPSVAELGGPALTIVSPVDRGATDISFTTLPSAATALSIGAPLGAELTLDGRPIRLVPIEGSAHGVSRVTIGPGTHRLRSTEPLSGSLQGVGFNGAFLHPIVQSYPGGLR